MDTLTLNSFPIIKRAKGCYLYTANGERYLDLYMNNGTATLGHTPPNAGLALKNPIDQGLTMPYPNLWNNRLLKALQQCYPNYHIALYNNGDPSIPSIVKTCSEPWEQSNACTALRPLFDLAQQPYHCYLSSFGSSLATIVLAITPLPSASSPLPAFIAKALLRFVNRRQVEINPTIATLFDASPLWSRYGCYITSTLDPTAYQQLVKAALQQYIVLPPTVNLVGLIPPSLSKGELMRLKTLFDN